MKPSKLRKYLFQVEFMYVKDTEPQALRFVENFYETHNSLENCIDTIERVMLRLGYQLISAKIIKQS